MTTDQRDSDRERIARLEADVAILKAIVFGAVGAALLGIVLSLLKLVLTNP